MEWTASSILLSESLDWKIGWAAMAFPSRRRREPQENCRHSEKQTISHCPAPFGSSHSRESASASGFYSGSRGQVKGTLCLDSKFASGGTRVASRDSSHTA